ncbi:hypothetical protein C1894_09480 [Pseudomonas sp. FW305-3-2-15-E-TSA2]|nr:hypothetical protein C1895_12880 [Pseudomonas sp. FW305-3-2-15-E-TSA4]POA43111.1 hypothetical protein C1894_09480 [Pseudomonas sp. FW305-3-2-15-E-TSA2]
MIKLAHLWRGDSSPMGCEAAPKPENAVHLKDPVLKIATAAQSIGDKSPHHKRSVRDQTFL